MWHPRRNLWCCLTDCLNWGGGGGGGGIYVEQTWPNDNFCLAELCFEIVLWRNQNVQYKHFGSEGVNIEEFWFDYSWLYDWFTTLVTFTCIGKRYLFHVAHTSVITHCLCRFWLACLQLNTVVHKVTFKTWIWKRFYPYAAHKGVCLCIDLGAGESRGGRPGLSVLTSLLVSVDVKLYWTMLWHWSQLVPNMSADIQRY